MPIVVGGQIVYPGDIVVADSDGIVFIRPDQAEQVLEQSKKITARGPGQPTPTRRNGILQPGLGL